MDLGPPSGDGWTSYGFRRSAPTSSFLADSDRVRLRFWWHESREQFEARAWFGPGAEGPPGHIHGGAIFAVMDEVMGAAAWAGGMKVFAAHVAIRYTEMLPLDNIVKVQVWQDRTEGRKIWMKSGLKLNDTVYAKAEGLFIQPSPEKLSLFRDLGMQPR